MIGHLESSPTAMAVCQSTMRRSNKSARTPRATMHPSCVPPLNKAPPLQQRKGRPNHPAQHHPTANDGSQSARTTMTSSTTSRTANHIAAFYKTRFCRYYTHQGACWKGDACQFAHDRKELRAPPDLTKTRMCSLFRLGFCTLPAESCPFAHSLSELKSTDTFFKTELCSFWSAGFCRAGVACRHAHGEQELRPQGAAAVSLKSTTDAPSSTKSSYCPLSSSSSSEWKHGSMSERRPSSSDGSATSSRCDNLTAVPMTSNPVTGSYLWVPSNKQSVRLSSDEYTADNESRRPSYSVCAHHQRCLTDEFPSAKNETSFILPDPSSRASFMSFVTTPRKTPCLMVVCQGVPCQGIPESLLEVAGWAVGVASNDPFLVSSSSNPNSCRR